MIVTSQNPMYQLFSQSLKNNRSNNREDVVSTTSPSNNAVNMKQDTSSTVAPDSNVKSAIGQALVLENGEKVASVTREVEVDSSHAETLSLVKGFGDGRMVLAEMSKKSTAERPEIYLEVRDNNETKAYLIDINNIDPSRMSRIEALALAQHMIYRDDYKQSTLVHESTETGETIVSGDPGDWSGRHGIVEMASGFWGKNPTDHFDYHGPDSLDEEIDFFQLVQSNISQVGSLPQEGLDAVGSYLSKLESNESLSASDKMKGTLDLLQALSDANNKADTATQKKGVDKLAGMLEKPASIVYSWVGGTGQFVASNEADTPNEDGVSDRQDFTNLFKKARSEMYSNKSPADKYDWWNTDKDER